MFINEAMKLQQQSDVLDERRLFGMLVGAHLGRQLSKERLFASISDVDQIDCGIMQRMAFESLTLKEQDIVLRCMKATADYVDDCEKRLT